MTGGVTIEPVAYEDKSVLARLLQLYMYDFTEYLPMELNAHGEFEYRYLDHYWAPAPDEQRHAFFIRVERKLAGFAMVRVVNEVNVMAEIFVLRPFRRGGAGSAAARIVLRKFPGRWLVHQVPNNLPAQAFWRRIISEVTGGAYEEELEADGAVAQRFEIEG